MNYYQAGYYLIKINKVDYGSLINRELMTASNCINESFFDDWSFSWTIEGEDKEKVSEEHGLTPEKINDLQNWVDFKFEANKIGWQNIFYSLDALEEYKEKFFKERTDLIKMGLSFSATETEDLLEAFEPRPENGGEIGIRHGLMQKLPENPAGKFIGYDIIGVELDGTFHTIHCHDLQNELESKFGLAFNENGLIENCATWKEVTDFCNDPSNGLEPVPWYHCKVKIYE